MHLNRITFPGEEGWNVELASDIPSVLRPIVGNLSLTALFGRNGSGKSYLLSAIVRLFHHVDWYQDRIPVPLSVEYTLNGSGNKPVALQWDGVSATVARRDETPRRIVDSTKGRREPTNDGLEDLLPTVIASVFSTQGEYPARKIWNARGLRHTTIYDIAKLYGTHHYDLGSLSGGLARFVSEEFAPARNVLFGITGLKPLPEVLVHPTAQLLDRLRADNPRMYHDAYNASGQWTLDEWEQDLIRQEYSWLEPDWIPVQPAVLDAEGRGDIYINDILLETPDKDQASLMTLSAGQKMLLVRLLSILSTVNNNSLVVLEEPELHLDPVWCGALVDLFGAFFGQFSAHLIVATQSMPVLRCFPTSALHMMTKHGPRPPPAATFLGSESVLADILFRGSSLAALDVALLEQVRNGDADVIQGLLPLLAEGPLRFLVHLEAIRRGLK